MTMQNNGIDKISNALQGMKEAEIKRLMQAEGRRLKYIALKIWRETMSEYKPRVYAVHLGKKAGQRTRNSARAIKLGSVRKQPDGTFTIELTWDNDLVYHDSIFQGQPKGHSVMLISEGWHSRKLEDWIGRGGKDGRIERFTYFEGTGYLYKVYKEYMKSAPNGIYLDVQWSGAYTKK